MAATAWRLSSRCTSVSEALEALEELVRSQLAIEDLVVLRIDAANGRIENVARPADRMLIAPDRMRLLLEWCASGEILVPHRDAPAWETVAPAIPKDGRGRMAAAPLWTKEGPPGLLLATLVQDKRLDAAGETLFSSIVDPLAAALVTENRLRELSELRAMVQPAEGASSPGARTEQEGRPIVGADSGLRPVMERVELVSRSDAPVLLFGETGSGKEVIARAIHQRSARARGPFVRVNCGAIAPELIDSELFGHEKGSFTGAVSTRRGWFERADGGTLLLDEIGELPLPAQVRLLRVLQDGSFERVGGETTLRVDLRIVAATHRDLPSMIQNGRFREDLWYRIAVFPVVIPPLREHLQDIPALAAHFALRAAKRFGLTPQLPTASDMALLASYDWPGNIRELAAVIDRAVILGDGKGLAIAPAIGFSGGVQPRLLESEPGTFHRPRAETPRVLPLDEASRRHIEAALVTSGGRIQGRGGAAELLAIHPNTLRARMRKLRVDWKSFRHANRKGAIQRS